MSKKKKKGGGGGGQKLAFQFDCHHRAGENLTFFPKDRSLFLGSIVITKQVETSHFFPKDRSLLLGSIVIIE